MMPDAARPCYALLASMPDRTSTPFLALALGAAVAALLAPAACASSAPTPFGVGGDSGGGGQGGEGGGGGTDDLDPTLGGPCVDDGQCDDGLSCTFDACDKSINRCRFTPDDLVCQNDIYCDGVERCVPKLGCRAGEPVDCGDANTCTIDTCVEATRQCDHVLRDADQDGDPDIHCGGGDCDDTDPTVSSLFPEICANGRDDNCNGVIDEAACVAPAHDTCIDALEISQPGTYAVNTIGAAFDYATQCSPAGPTPLNDIVAAILLPPGPPVDVEVTARADFADVAVALAGQCGNAASEIACGKSYPAPQFGKIAKLRGRNLGDPTASTALPLYVTTAGGSAVLLDVAFRSPTPIPTNETCGTAVPLVAGAPVNVEILDATKDLGSACETTPGELVYSFELLTPQDVHVYATSLDGDGVPSISLRDPGCALPENEVTCQTANPSHLFRHALPPGTYFVGVSATAPTTVALTLEVAPPTPSPADETCLGAPPMPVNQTVQISLAAHQDDIQATCLVGARDAAYTLDLSVASDVLLVERLSQGDTGAISLLAPACEAPSDLLVCSSGSSSPMRAARYNVPTGEYRVVAETLFAQPVEVSALVRPASPPTLVVFSDGCSDAMEIPPGGGRFQGTTANARADFDAGCDQSGVPPGGAADQILKLVLPARKRVVLDMAGSGYTTLLNVRRGPACPGAEMPFACTIGTGQGSFLDLVLDPGTYYLQIDGLAGNEGPWFLDVRVVDPPS
ncbi:putative metal-binding motif-containing protein [Chondromyces crocatus]|uniref:Peptidase C-terminal archaeal/bacterial domain-containing protein n=1 Tax=Chondromyces crocatus TaxID=52 RepID=A0A0K1E7E8_CHOCO|nr:putative metal-binding motif-containing protein [Chondromyces crocatus]AKT36784.1 uncharacterized protein CMC5_009050 [Chondromyces crocatus]